MWQGNLGYIFIYNCFESNFYIIFGLNCRYISNPDSVYPTCRHKSESYLYFTLFMDEVKNTHKAFYKVTNKLKEVSVNNIIFFEID